MGFFFSLTQQHRWEHNCSASWCLYSGSSTLSQFSTSFHTRLLTSFFLEYLFFESSPNMLDFSLSFVQACQYCSLWSCGGGSSPGGTYVSCHCRFGRQSKDPDQVYHLVWLEVFFHTSSLLLYSLHLDENPRSRHTEESPRHKTPTSVFHCGLYASPFFTQT